MKVPLDESLSERDFESEFDAIPPSPSPGADLLRARGLERSRRRRHVALAAAAAAAAATGVLLLPALQDQFAVPAGPPPNTRTATPVPSANQPLPGSCTGTVRLVGPQEQVLVSRSQTPTVRIRVGDVLRVEADGRCGAAVTLGSQNDSKLRSADGRTATAVQPGSTEVDLVHPMCAALTPPQPGCAGGIAFDGRVRVVIRR